MLALVGYGAVRLTHQPANTPDAVASSSAPPPSSAPPERDGWPVTAGACGSQAPRPLIDADPVGGHTGLRLLVGGAELAEVDVDYAEVRTRSEVPQADRNQARTLVGHGTDAYALVAPCEGARPGSVFRVSGRGEVRRVRLSGPVDALIGGPSGVLGVDYPPDDATPGGSSPVRLRWVGGRTIAVDGSLLPLGVTSAGVVALANGEHADGEPPQLVLLDASTGHVTRTVAGGYPIGVGGDSVVWHGKACQYLETGPAARCVLHVTDVARGADRSYRLPAGRMPMSDAVFSPDGGFLALQISDSRGDTRYAFDHPGPSSAVAVLDLRSGRLQVMPGLELPPKTGAGFAFSRDGRWLAVTVSEGDHGHVLAWRLGSDRLLRSEIRLAGPLDRAPPVLALP
ncbi:MAG TPA: hypothetical protein VF053_07735 [Streptosporangiales bacterium]